MSLSALVAVSKRVYVIGNGGSFANASHIVNDLLSVGVKAYSMDPATLTAFANDFGYEKAFEKWLDIVGEAGDLLIALSGSGKSPNILKAVSMAQSKGMTVWCEYGAEKGLGMQASEEKQIKLGHEVMMRLRDGHTR